MHCSRHDVLDLNDLAEIFRRASYTMRATLKRWIADEGFPEPLPGRSGRNLWSAARVRAWIDAPDAAARRQLAMDAKAADGAVPAQVVEEARARLEARYRRAA